MQFIYVIAHNRQVERDLFRPKIVAICHDLVYLELLITRHILSSPLEFEVTRVDCISNLQSIYLVAFFQPLYVYELCSVPKI